MKLFHGLETLGEPPVPATVAIGTFDGIHVGHQAIIRTAVEDATAHRRISLVFTFDRHPADLLAPGRAPDYVTTPAQRNEVIEELGVDGLVVAAFDHALAQLTPDEFVDRVLRSALGAETVVVGENFAFGHNRSGNVDFLRAAQGGYGYRLVALPPVIVHGSPASSTRVRDLIHGGRMDEAEAVLGHPFWLVGEVVEGRKLGRELGYPTANIDRLWRQAVPADGIYAVQARLDDGRVLPGACSIGDRPTIAGAGRSIETYLLDFDEDLYGRTMELRFVRRLRHELKFDSLDALKTQMARDVIEAREILASV
jgi:riboflavin kinase/FMN adenylyltransferase